MRNNEGEPIRLPLLPAVPILPFRDSRYQSVVLSTLALRRPDFKLYHYPEPMPANRPWHSAELQSAIIGTITSASAVSAQLARHAALSTRGRGLYLQRQYVNHCTAPHGVRCSSRRLATTTKSSPNS